MTILPSVVGRLRRNFAANATTPAITALLQLIGLPIFLAFWGVDRYGEWLLLNAVSAYFVLTDLGTTNVASNEMAMAVASGRRDDASVMFKSANLYISLIQLSTLMILALLVWRGWVQTALSSAGHNYIGLAVSLLPLAAYSMLSTRTALLVGGFRCDGHNAFAIWFVNVIRLFEFCIVFFSLVLGADIRQASVALLVGRLVGHACMWLTLQTRVPWLFIATAAPVRTTIPLLRPGLSYLAIPFGNIIAVQGPLIVIGTTLGAPATVLFSSLRTLARMALMVMGTVNNTFWPEISAAYGAGNQELVRNLHRVSSNLSFWLGTTAVGILSLTGSMLLRLWTGDRVEMDWTVFSLLLTGVLLSSMWYTSLTVPMATNRHGKPAIFFAVAAIASVVASVPLAKTYGLNGVTAATLFLEVLMAMYVVPYTLQIADDRLSTYLRYVLKPSMAWRSRS